MSLPFKKRTAGVTTRNNLKRYIEPAGDDDDNNNNTSTAALGARKEHETVNTNDANNKNKNSTDTRRETRRSSNKRANQQAPSLDNKANQATLPHVPPPPPPQTNSNGNDKSKNNPRKPSPPPQRSIQAQPPVQQQRSSRFRPRATNLGPYYKSPPPPPNAGDDLKGTWTYNEETRVLLADFRDVEHITAKEKEHLLRMMERDDISVVSWGLVEPLKVSDALLVRIEKEMRQNSPYHKFRRFDRVTAENGETYYKEVEFHSMFFQDFRAYLKLRMKAPLETFEFMDRSTKQLVRLERVGDVDLYLIDTEMSKYVPRMGTSYKNSFKISEILPGGNFCMMSALPESARPFMGPNLYLTRGGFTSFHQDGHGTVDSGHSCLSGFNEVVMLRRLPEEHKLNAMNYLHYHGQHAIYHLPHDSQKIDQQIWPTNDTVAEWTQMNYCPSIFILRPGQHLHINKGRLHCFRKLTSDQLGPNDCHAGLRQELIEEVESTPNSCWDYICLSIAFDWMYIGFTEPGIEEEVRSCLECAQLCKTHEPKPLKYLAIPETSLVKIVSRLCKPIESPLHVPRSSDVIFPDPLSVAKGILSSFRAIVDREIAHSKIEMSRRALKPDHEVAADQRRIDPFVGSTYICKLCHAELSNTYYQCIGCQTLLSKFMLICPACYDSEKYHSRVRINVVNNKWLSDLNHIGIKNNGLKASQCGCHQGPCRACDYCKACSCQCHLEFEQKQRFYTVKKLKDFLKHIGRLVGVPEPDDEDDPKRIRSVASVPESKDGSSTTTQKRGHCASLFVEEVYHVSNDTD